MGMYTDNCCVLCDSYLGAFAITPILKNENGNTGQICVPCANENFPGWKDDEDDE